LCNQGSEQKRSEPLETAAELNEDVSEELLVQLRIDSLVTVEQLQEHGCESKVDLLDAMLADLVTVGQLHTAGARRPLNWAQPPNRNVVATDYAEERVRAREYGPFRAPSWSFIHEAVEEFNSQSLGRRSFIKKNAKFYAEKTLRDWDKLLTDAKGRIRIVQGIIVFYFLLVVYHVRLHRSV